MEGIGANKAVDDFIVAVIMAQDKSLADGKWDWSDLINFWEPVKLGYSTMNELKNLMKEWADLSQDEIKVLVGYFSGKLDISNDMLESAIEAGYNVALNIAKFAAIKLGK